MGKDLVLTLDLGCSRRWKKLWTQLTHTANQWRGTVCKACAVGHGSKVRCYPRHGRRAGFNPNLFVRGISTKDWRAINQNPFDPMTDKAIGGEYPAGSTFKVVTGSAALDLLIR